MNFNTAITTNGFITEEGKELMNDIPWVTDQIIKSLAINEENEELNDQQLQVLQSVLMKIVSDDISQRRTKLSQRLSHETLKQELSDKYGKGFLMSNLSPEDRERLSHFTFDNMKDKVKSISDNFKTFVKDFSNRNL